MGYVLNAKKCWIIAKPEKEALVREAFKDTAINVTTEGHKDLGAVVGSTAFLNEYITNKVTSWTEEMAKLAEFALSQPQACYAAFTIGLKHRWAYFLRTLPDIQDLLEPLENVKSNVLIPAIKEHSCSSSERDILALPVRHGGLGITNPCHETNREYQSSVKVTMPLVEKIVS